MAVVSLLPVYQWIIEAGARLNQTLLLVQSIFSGQVKTENMISIISSDTQQTSAAPDCHTNTLSPEYPSIPQFLIDDGQYFVPISYHEQNQQGYHTCTITHSSTMLHVTLCYIHTIAIAISNTIQSHVSISSII